MIVFNKKEEVIFCSSSFYVGQTNDTLLKPDAPICDFHQFKIHYEYVPASNAILNNKAGSSSTSSNDISTNKKRQDKK